MHLHVWTSHLKVWEAISNYGSGHLDMWVRHLEVWTSHLQVWKAISNYGSGMSKNGSHMSLCRQVLQCTGRYCNVHCMRRHLPVWEGISMHGKASRSMGRHLQVWIRHVFERAGNAMHMCMTVQAGIMMHGQTS